MKSFPIHIVVIFVLLLSLPSCSKKNAGADITIYELQTKNIEHLLVCLDHFFAMIPEQTSAKQNQANTLVGLLNITTAHLLILNDQLKDPLGEEQMLELTKMSKRLNAVHEDLLARLKAIQGNSGEQQSDITNTQGEQDGGGQPATRPESK